MKGLACGLLLALALSLQPPAISHQPGYAKPLPSRVWSKMNAHSCYTQHTTKTGIQFYNRCGPLWEEGIPQ